MTELTLKPARLERSAIAATIVSGGRAPLRPRARFSRWVFVALCLPTLAAALYYSLLAAPIYVSESKFIVRAATPQVSPSSIGSILRTGAIARSPDDTYFVQDYIGSRDALRELLRSLPVRDIYRRPEADRLARFPRFWESDSFDGLFRYFGSRVEVIRNSLTGITTLRTAAFRPEDAAHINETLLAQGRAFLLRLNERAQQDSVGYAARELDDARRLVLTAQSNLSDFRNAELMVDPKQTSTLMLDLVGRLSAELATARTRRATVLESAPNSAELPALNSRIGALESQIAREQSKIVGQDSSVAPRISEYERLNLERTFAEKSFMTASTALQEARAEARRQQLYLELVVAPNVPDEADQPKALKNIALISGLVALGYLILALTVTAVRDYVRS